MVYFEVEVNKNLLYLVGLILMVAAGIMTVPVPVSVYFGELSMIPYFLVPAAVSLLIGLLIWWNFDRKELTYGEAMVVAAMGWLIISFIGSIPFFYGTDLGPLSSYFESMSGFTTTGLTMFKMEGPGMITGANPNYTILVWRSLTQWVGGMGIMILFLSTVIGTGKIAMHLFSAEGGGGRTGPDGRKSPEATVRSSARSVWKIYVFYTLMAIALLYFVGMPMFESINHAMTALGTGGFSVTSDSFASYSGPILIATLFPMILGATSFATHREMFRGKWKNFFKSSEFQLMIFLIGASTFLLAWNVGLMDGLFSSVSAQTTVGFSSAGETSLMAGEGWGALEKSVVVFQMVIGGGFGSTAGAIKLIRTVVLMMSLYWLVKRALLPERAVVPFKLGEKVFSEGEVLQTAIFAFTYIFFLVIGSLVTMAAVPAESAINCIFDSASAQGTVGLSAGITGSGMPVVVKATYIIQMWIGRLEVIPVATMFGYFFRRI